MTLLADREAIETPAAAEPRQGVIEEARRRERARRLRRLRGPGAQEAPIRLLQHLKLGIHG
ncbi:MAG TPA: hypothetical protein VMB91_13130 [Solirubrobacteraceae bacterium]|nr:hypothetical protein [Solirubrobacteraceae bacterium]